MIQQSDLLWGQQAKVNNSLRQKIDQKIGLTYSFVQGALPEISDVKNVAKIEDVVIPAINAAEVTKKISEAKTSLEEVCEVDYRIEEGDVPAAPTDMETDETSKTANVSINIPAIPSHVTSNNYLSSPLKRKIFENVFGETELLDVKRPRQRLNITPINKGITEYKYVDPFS